jgi:hypothetical protein
LGVLRKNNGCRKRIDVGSLFKIEFVQTTEIEGWIQENDTSRNDGSMFHSNTGEKCGLYPGEEVRTFGMQ